ncbi:alpha-2,3-sialyltransferase [Roseibium algae]|uniref:Alpha-2,3-sialyltransferase n=1 Tax=Roseibium algae TaxID=3123038 RepID=A0ABU8TS62_9HYPH
MKKVAIIGNGPSASQYSLSDLPGGCEIARCNFFFLEREARFGNKVNHYFWSLNNPTLHDGLVEVLNNKKYSIQKFYSPVPARQFKFEQKGILRHQLLNRLVFDHWKRISRNPEISRYLMSRPFPTTGMQALAMFAIEGYRDISVVGIDFYQTNVRYNYDPPAELLKAMDPKHFQAGYEKGAHSLDIDTSFLLTILENYPRIRIRNIANNHIFNELASRRRGRIVSYDNPAY